MEYTSFYGGRRGTPFVIVKSYPDIPTMVFYFSKGDDYKQVNYDEYVIINAYKRDHPDNGKIFRRGYDIYSDRTIICTCAKDPSTNMIAIDKPKSFYLATTTKYVLDTAFQAKGAKYIGKIQGPPGIAPILKLMTYAGATGKYDQQYQEDRKSIGSFTIGNKDLVSGKSNNEIKWVVANISEENSDLDKAYAYIGFKIPYPVIEFSAVKITQYDKDGNYTTSIQQPLFTGDLSKRPFYHPWKLYIPKGIKGDCLRNFKVISPSKNDKIYDLNYYLETGKKKIYDGLKNDADYTYKNTKGDTLPGRQILVYTEIVYDLHEAGDKTCFYVADYNTMTSMDIQEDGSVSIYFTHEDPRKYPKLLKWITNITLNKSKDGKTIQPGHFVIHYNNDSYNQTKVSQYDLDWVNNLILQSDGQVKQEFTGGRASEYITDKKDYPTGQLNEEDYLRVRWINEVEVQNDGTLIVTFNDIDRQGNHNLRTFTKKIKWLQKFQIQGQNGKVTYKFNNEDEDVVNQLVFPTDIYLQQQKGQWSSAEDVSFLQEGTGDQSFYVRYTNTPDENPGKRISPSINYILATDITPDKHLIVLYADKEKRELFKTNADDTNYIGKEKAYKFYPNGVVDDPVYYNIYRNDKYGCWTETKQVQGVQVVDETVHLYDGWLDLGVSSSDTGLLIGADVPIQTIQEETYQTIAKEQQQLSPTKGADFLNEDDKQARIISYLNTTYPVGLGKTGNAIGTSETRDDIVIINPFLVDKIITTGDLSTDKKYFVGFDFSFVENTYNFVGWYILGSLQQAAVAVGEQSQESAILPTLADNGLFFVIGDAYSMYDQDYVNTLTTPTEEIEGEG